MRSRFTRYLVLTLLLAAAGQLAVTAFNAAVDPYGMLSTGGRVEGEQADTHNRLAKAYQNSLVEAAGGHPRLVPV